MGELRFLTGRANSGWRDALYAEVGRSAASGAETVLIVPEQSTFAAERRLAENGKGFIGIQVLSVERLSERVLADAGRTLPFLSRRGVSMVVRRAAIKREDELRIFSRAARKTGFSTELAALFGEMKRALVTPECLKETAERLREDSLLKEKFGDLSVLYEETEAWLNERYLTTDDRMTAAIRLLPQSFLKNSRVFFDYDGLLYGTNQFDAFFRAVLTAADCVTVGMTEDTGSDSPVFARLRTERERLSAIAGACGCAVSLKEMKREACRGSALSHFERYFFEGRPPVFPDGAENIVLYEASDRRNETEALGNAILQAAREGVRFREMAVLVTDFEGYEAPLSRSMALREIPFFMDTKKPLAAQAAAETVSAALACITDGYAPQDVLRLAKCGYAGADFSGSETFENYVLRYGVRGVGFLHPFDRGKTETELAEAAEAERIRQTLTEPLERLREGLHGRTVREKVFALYGYLTELKLSEQLSEKARLLLASGRPREAAEHTELWRLICELLDQLYNILGDAALNREDFRAVLEEGLSGETLGVIPDSADRVLIGDMTHTRPDETVRALFVLGANDGLLPRILQDDGLINNAELRMLSDRGMPVWNGTSYSLETDRARLYQVLGMPRDRLYFSFSNLSDGKELLPSSMINRLRGMFPGCVSKNFLTEEPFCASERVAFRRLSGMLREDSGNGLTRKQTEELAAYFAASDRYRDRLKQMKEEARGQLVPSDISAKTAALLYRPDRQMSASRLESYNRCPFGYFAAYGLGAEERKEAAEKSSDAGAFYHAVLERFISYCIEHGYDFGTMTEEDADGVLDTVLPEVMKEHNDGILLFNRRLRVSFFLMEETARQSVHAVLYQIRSGKFRPCGAEVRFGDGCAFPAIRLALSDGRTVRIGGVIDRIDRAKAGETDYLRIIDYKTSGRKMDFGAVAEGLSLQLPLYLSAVTSISGTPSGMYYMPVSVPQPKDGQSAEEALRESFRLAGLTLNDPKVFECTEPQTEKESAVLSGIRRNKDGTVSGPVVDGGGMMRVLKTAKTVSERTAARILKGEAPVSPSEKACKYCRLRSVCRFDAAFGCRERKSRKLKLDDFLALIGDNPNTADDGASSAPDANGGEGERI